MDFSLLQFHSRHFWLRDILALKTRWPYYFIMVVDPILRFNWILYVVLPMDANHSTVFSFGVALLEVTRRGMWALFRVENEHCANVGQYKASRDVPLPYRIEPLMAHATSTEASPVIRTNSKQEELPLQQSGGDDPSQKRTEASYSSSSAGAGPSTASSTAPLQPAAAHTQTQGRPQRQPSSSGTAARLAAFSTATSTTAVGSSGTSQSLFRRRTDSARTFSKMLADAHTQDFEKKRKKKKGDGLDGGEHGTGAGGVASVDSDDGEDDDDDSDDSADEERMAVRESARLMRGGQPQGSAIIEEEV